VLAGQDPVWIATARPEKLYKNTRQGPALGEWRELKLLTAIRDSVALSALEGVDCRVPMLGLGRYIFIPRPQLLSPKWSADIR